MPARVVQQLIRDARLLDANPRCCDDIHIALLSNHAAMHVILCVGHNALNTPHLR